eukprot:scpid7978/ scgid0060/ Fumarylacetoacetate hydrolase domain-containing protein 2
MNNYLLRAVTAWSCCSGVAVRRCCNSIRAGPVKGTCNLPLRLVQFRNQDDTGRARVGAQVVASDPRPGQDESTAGASSTSSSGEMVDITAAIPGIGGDMKQLLESGDVGMRAVKQAIESGKHRLDSRNVRLCAPILNPDKIICVGLNYHDHCRELNYPVPTEPAIFSKLFNALAGPLDDIVMPDETKVSDT